MPSHSQAEAEPNLLQVLFVLRRRVVLIVATSLLGLVAGIATCALMKPRYDAVADLNIHPEGSAALDLGDLGDLASGSGGLDWNSKLETQVHILKSDALAWDVITQLRLDQNKTFAAKDIVGPDLLTPVGQDASTVDARRKDSLLRRFSRSLRAEAIPKTQIIEIRFRSTDPILAARVVNALSAAYVQHNFMTRFEATMQASAWLQQRLNELKNNVELSQRKLNDYQKKANIIGNDETDNLAITNLTDVSKQMTDAEADRIMKEAKYRLAQSGNPELIGTILPDSVLPVLRSQEADLQNQLAQAEARFGPNYPRVMQLHKQLDQVHSSLTKELSDIETRFRSEYESAKRTEDQLRISVESRKREAFAQTEKFSEYGILKNQAESGHRLYEDLLTKLNEAGIAAGLKSTNVDLIDPAAVPVNPVLPKIPVFLMIGSLVGGFLGVCGAFVLESVDHTISTPEEVERLCATAVIGTIPHFSPRGISRGLSAVRSERGHVPIAVDRPTSKLAEAFHALRTSILLATPGLPPKVVIVTSAQPGDGKSTVSLNVATVLAQSGARVLLVDADLRRGTIAQTLALDASIGLTECITGTADWNKCIQPSSFLPNLAVLPAGNRPPSPADLLISTQMNRLIEQWRAEFDHVIIDTPPIIAVTDGVVLSQRVDAVILIARTSQTGRHPLRQARGLLGKVGAKLIGVVVNDFDVNSQYYGYHNAYDKYYLEEEGNTKKLTASK